MLFIKINVKGYLKNLTENNEDIINTTSIKKSNKLNYIIDNTKYQLIIDNNKVTLLRENNEFSHGITFIENKTTSSEFYLKEQSYSIEFNIKTIKLLIEENKIDITYKILETENIYNYVLEMSDSL